MNFRNLFFLLFISMGTASCANFMKVKLNRGFYDHEKSEYNLEKAKEQLIQLENSTLIVLIPCEARKQNLLKKTNFKKYKANKKQIDDVKKSLMIGVSQLYDFSKYVFLPDSVYNDFLKKNDTNHFYDKNGNISQNHSIDTSSTYFVLRSFRDFDQLFIYDKHNKWPNQPFPYESSVGTNQLFKTKRFLTKKEYLEKIDEEDTSLITGAIYILNKRLHDAKDALK